MAAKRTRKKKAAPVVDIVKVEETLTPERALLEGQLQLIHSAPLSTQEHADMFGAMITDIRQRRDAHEALRKETKAPALEAGRAVDRLFKPLKDLYDAMDTAASKRLSEFLATGATERDEALARLAAGDRDPETLAKAHGQIEIPEGLTETESIEFEITDAAQIPRQFMCLDESLARAWVKHKRKAGEPHEIPGVKVIVATNVKRTGGKK